MMRDHPLIYVNDMSNLMSSSSSFGEPSANPIHQPDLAPPHPANPNHAKRKRSLPGNPDPEAEVIALSPKSLLATNRFVCEICNKGFQRDQNLQLHRRGHNLPWKLKQKSEKEVRKKVYVCPEVSCVHHDPARALGDLTGIKKHFCRKHWEKKWKCDRCSKKYAVQSDWKAHIKICGTKEYRCNCGTLFSRRDSFTTHRAFCDALSQENMRSVSAANPLTFHSSLLLAQQPQSSSLPQDHGTYQFQQSFPLAANTTPAYGGVAFEAHQLKRELVQQEVPSWASCHQGGGIGGIDLPSSFMSPASASYPISLTPHMSATALLQTAAQMGVTIKGTKSTPGDHAGYVTAATGPLMGLDGTIDDAFGGILGLRRHENDDTGRLVRRREERSSDGMTRDFLGLKALYSGDHIIDMAAGIDRAQEYEQIQQQQQNMGGSWHV